MGWRNGQAYSQDLRERVLAAVDGGMAVRRAAPLFKVSIAFIYKALIRRRATGETAARPQRSQLGRKLAAYDGAIAAAVKARPEITISELRARLLSEHGVSISHAGMWTTLDRLGLTVKKRRSGRPSRTGRSLRRSARTGANGKAR